MLSNELEYLSERRVPTRARRAPRVHHGRAPAARHCSIRRRSSRSCGVRRRSRAPAPRAEGIHRRIDAAPARRRRRRVATCSRRSAFSACCSARCFTCSRAARRKSRRRTCSSRSSARSNRTRCICSACKTSRGSTSSTTSRTALPKIQEAKPESEDGNAEASATAKASSRSRSFTTNLNALAEAGKIDPLIGRQLEIERTVEILCRRRKNNPLYVGEAGVGKTALAEGLARLIVEGKVPDVLRRLHDLRARHGLADRGHQVSRRFREAPEGRHRGPEEAARRDPVHRRDPHRDRRGRRLGRRDGRVEPHQAGARERRAALHRLDHLSANTAGSSRRTTRSRGASRRSTSPSRPSARRSRSCAASRRRFEEHHGISYSDEALRAAAELSSRHINDRHLPDKAIDVIDEAGARLRLQPEASRAKIGRRRADRGHRRAHRADSAEDAFRRRIATCCATSSAI